MSRRWNSPPESGDGELRPPGAGLVRWTALAAAIVLLATDALYVAVIASQGSEPGTGGRVAFVVAFVGLMAVACAVASFLPTQAARSAALGGAVGGCGALGVIAVFSIGLLFFVAAAFAVAALLGSNRVSPSRTALAVAGGVGAVAVLAAGLLAT